MSKEIKRRRGNAAQHASFTGAVGEVTIDQTNQRARVHDGSTPGGFPTVAEADIATADALGSSDTKVPSQSALKSYLDNFFKDNDTDVMTTKGDLAVQGGGSPASVDRLGYGDAGKVLRSDGSMPYWGDRPGYIRVVAATTVNVALSGSPSDLDHGDLVDGVTIQNGDLVLVKSQDDPGENGIYEIMPGGPMRSFLFNTWDHLVGLLVHVLDGDKHQREMWCCVSDFGSTLDAGSPKPAVNFSRIYKGPTVTVLYTSDIFGFVAVAASGTYTPPDGCKFIRVRATGAGAGGGGVRSTSSGSGRSESCGGGGGGGATSEMRYQIAPGDTFAYSLGSGGNGGSSGNPGQDGGDTVFGTITVDGGHGAEVDGTGSGAVAGGGYGGDAQESFSPIDGSGFGGNGGDAGWGEVGKARGGRGGGTYWGGGTKSARVQTSGTYTDGNDATSPGSGGSGGAIGNNLGNSGRHGGDGADGIIVIEEFYEGDYDG